jgi:hypothetical protein
MRDWGKNDYHMYNGLLNRRMFQNPWIARCSFCLTTCRDSRNMAEFAFPPNELVEYIRSLLTVFPSQGPPATKDAA